LLALWLCLTALPEFARAARDAWVTVPEAVVWGDVDRTAPLGYIRRGKKLRVGDANQQRGEVVPLAVSGRIAYVSVADLSFTEGHERVYTRFQDWDLYRLNQQVIFAGTGFNATESANKNADRAGDAWDFRGLTLKGLARTERQRMDIAVLLDFFTVDRNQSVEVNGVTLKRAERFNVFQFGVGASFAVIDAHLMKLKLEVIGLLSPWAQYSSGKLFATNGFGVGALGQVTLVLFGGDHWGVEAAGGYQVMQLWDIEPPPPFASFDPRFTGVRASLGIVRRY